MIVKTQGVIALKSAADLSLKEGYFVKGAAPLCALVAATTDVPVGCILDGEDATGVNSIALNGAYEGTCRVKLSGTVAQFALLQLAADGSVITDAGTGARFIVGRALEAGISGDLIEAILIFPDPRT